MNKLVSIISPCYNGEKYLRPFLDSVISQTYRPIELLFVDDGSTDGTKEIFYKYKTLYHEDNTISFNYYYESNAGQAAAINLALPLFKGEYLMWVDSDDILYPTNVEKKVNYLERNTKKGYVICQGEIVNSDNTNIPLKLLKRIHNNEPDTDIFRDLILEHNVLYGPGSIMVRREVINKSIPSLHIYEGRQGQNWQLMLPIAYCSEIGYIDEVLFKYVIHSDSHSHSDRTYEQRIQRANAFEKLICETIKYIPEISNDICNYWCTITKIKYARENLRLSYIEREEIESKKYFNILLKLNSVKIFDYKIPFIIKLKLGDIYRRFRNKCIKIINR